MIETQNQDIEKIPESRAARWAWRVSLIPVIGIPLFILLAFIALYRIGSKGQTGFWFLRRGVIFIFAYTGIYFGVYLAGLTGIYPKVYEKLYFYLPKHGAFYDQFGLLTYSFGKHEGKTIEFDPNTGKKLSEGFYRNDKANGRWTYWYTNGRKCTEGEVVDGNAVGTWKSWSPDGKEENLIVYKEPNLGTGKTWHQLGDICIEKNMQDGKPIGKNTGWYPSGKKACEWYWINGNIEGKTIWWYENGNVKSKSTWRNGKPEGAETRWHENGQRDQTGNYVNGRRSGTWTYWDESGNKVKEVDYDENGNEQTARTFSNKQPTPAPTPISKQETKPSSAPVKSITPEQTMNSPATTPTPQATPKVISRDYKVVHVFVCLCDNINQGIVKVPEAIGNGQSPDNNLYWGAQYGVKNFFKKSANWAVAKTCDATTETYILERVVFQSKNLKNKLVVVAEAYNGANMKNMLEDFFNACAGKKTVNLSATFGEKKFDIQAGGQADLVCFVGHNGLMDMDLDNLPESAPHPYPQKAVVLACKSNSYFADGLKKANCAPLLTTKDFMAPEAYVLDAALRSWGNGQSSEEIRKAAGAAYATYQKISVKSALGIFVAGE